MGLTALQQNGQGLGAGVPAYQMGEYRGASSTARFRDPYAEFVALRSGCGVYDLGYRGILSLTGSDRIRWLNGMVTNNIRDLQPGHGAYAFLLNPQGHIQGDLYAFHRPESVVLETDRSQIERMLALFDHYIIMDDVAVANLSDQLTALGIGGPQAREVMEKAGIRAPQLGPLQWLEIKCSGETGERRCTLIRTDEPLESYVLWMEAEGVKQVWDSLVTAGAMPIGFEAFELQRIVSGVPLFGVDIRERDLPQETEQARALNFNKGCYVGQEIVERIRSRGAVHRKFSGFLMTESTAVGAGAKIVGGEKEVGEVTSTAPFPQLHKTVALGYLRREMAVPGHGVIIGGREASVLSLPVGNDLLLAPDGALAERSA
jgi:folate-binding protein YgfZ